jgi:tetratricopeptide (TPR) repeat protein
MPSIETAHIALKNGAVEMAFAICRQLSESDKRSLEPLICQGDAALLLGRAEDAAAAYAAALTLAPRSQDALLGLGRLSLPNDARRAEAIFTTLLAEDPRDAIALNNLGIALDLQGRPDEAQSSYARAIASNPDMRAASINLALSLAIQGKPGVALGRLPALAGGRNSSIRERHDFAAIMAMAGRDSEAEGLLSGDLTRAEIQDALSGYRALHGGSR